MINARNIYKIYGERTVISGLSLGIEENICTVLMGPSGAGKTTLLNILSGLETPDSGIVTGTENRKKSFIFQENRLLENKSVIENILCVAPDRDRALFYLKKCGLEEHVNGKARDLSGGMKRRLAIARAFAYGGDLFFMDEPLREMDGETLSDVAAFMKNELRGKTAVMITHDHSQAEYFAGKTVLFSGPPLILL